MQKKRTRGGLSESTYERAGMCNICWTSYDETRTAAAGHVTLCDMIFCFGGATRDLWASSTIVILVTQGRGGYSNISLNRGRGRVCIFKILRLASTSSIAYLGNQILIVDFVRKYKIRIGKRLPNRRRFFLWGAIAMLGKKHDL